MRILLFPLLAAVSLSAQQPPASEILAPANLSIPAELNTPLKADRAHAGDIVLFKTLEAVLVGKGLVMPAKTKLYGHVLGAAPRQGQTPSWISVVIERAEWKEHILPLHAFISGHISSFLPVGDPVDPNAQQHSIGNHIGRHYPVRDPQAALAVQTPAGSAAGWNREANMQSPFLTDVKLGRQKSGMTFLFSEKHNLKLPGGILFLLQNVSAKAEPLDDPSVSSIPK